MILDVIRARYPSLGLAVFAMEPGQPVTIETYTPDGQVFSFTADTVEAALAKAFPEIATTDWEKLGRAQTRKLHAVLHIPGVKEALAELAWAMPDHETLDGPMEADPVEPTANVFD